MKELQPEEVELVGARLIRDKLDVDVKTCERIDWLLNDVLNIVGFSEKSGGWEKLYQDPGDGRYWLLTYPFSEMHGGGPPTLKHIRLAEEEVRTQFLSPEQWDKHIENFNREHGIRIFPGSTEEGK